MAKSENNQTKVVMHIELFPYEKQAFEEWVQGRYHSVADAVRSYIRKVTGLEPESQEKSSPNQQE